MMSTKSSNKSGNSGNSVTKRHILRLPKINELFSLRYFLITLRQQWPLFMLFAIVMFFAIPVVIVFGMNDHNYSVNWTPEKAYANLVETLAYLNWFISACAAVFAAISVTRDFMKPSASCFCGALPIRREGALIVRLTAGFVIYAAALIIGVLLGALVSIAVGAAQYLSLMLPIFVSLVIFLFIYTLVVACGMLCGTSITQFIMAGLVLVLPPLTYYMVIAWISEHIQSLWTNWYTDIDKLNIFPGIRLLGLIFDNNPMTGLEMLYYILLSLVLAAIAVVLFRMRINEHAGDAAIFRIVGPIVKYGSMIPAAFIGGFFFYELSYGGGIEDLFSWCFGWICASLLTFMLVNAVVHRSAKAVFRGIKWAPIFAGAFIIVNILIVGDAAGIDRYIPNPKTLSSIEFRVDGMTFNFKSEEAIRAIVKMAANDNDGNDGGEPKAEYYEPEFTHYEYMNNFENKGISVATTSNQINFNAAYRLRFGPVIAKSYGGLNKLRIADAIRELADTEEFRTQYADILKSHGDEFYVSLGLASGERSFTGHNNGYIDSFGIYHETDAVTIGGNTDPINSDYFARPQLGSVHMYGGEMNPEVPLFLDDALTDEINEAGKQIEEARKARQEESYGYAGTMTSDSIDEFVDSYISRIELVDTRTGEETAITNKAQMCEIMANVQSVCHGRASLFSIPDYNYYVMIYLKNNTRSYDVFLTYFLDGHIPEFVK